MELAGASGGTDVKDVVVTTRDITDRKMLEAQRQAAYSYQEWAEAEKGKGYYLNAMGGGRKNKATGQFIVWGWAQMANMVIRNPNLKHVFHEARYMVVKYGEFVELWRAGHDAPPNPCTYSNKCLINQLENPLGCYDESRFDSREEMVREILSVYEPELERKPAEVA
jgi:hypothetical protein